MKKLKMKTNLTLLLAVLAVIISGFTLSTTTLSTNSVVVVEVNPFDDGVCNIEYNDVTRFHLNKDRKLRNNVALESARYFETLKHVSDANGDSLTIKIKTLFKEYGYDTEFVGVILK